VHVGSSAELCGSAVGVERQQCARAVHDIRAPKVPPFEDDGDQFPRIRRAMEVEWSTTFHPLPSLNPTSPRAPLELKNHAPKGRCDRRPGRRHADCEDEQSCMQQRSGPQEAEVRPAMNANCHAALPTPRPPGRRTADCTASMMRHFAASSAKAMKLEEHWGRQVSRRLLPSDEE